MTILNKRRIVKLKKRLQKQTSILLALIIFIEVSYPTQVFALTGGPSQPEVQSFEPIGTSDMVDLFTGDFSYNLPLLDVEGYPVNIAYHSGISTDQEASWVGLGWNINPGVINRNMRGIPDDFSGEAVTKQFNMKPNKTWGVAVNGELEIFGFEKATGGIGLSLGFNYNNYTGPSVSKSFNINLSSAMGSVGRLNTGLGLSSSSDEGLTVQPSIGFSKKMQTAGNTETSLGLNIGTAFNSRSGLKQLSISGSASVSKMGDYMREGSDNYSRDRGNDINKSSFTQASASLGSVGAGGSFDFGQPTYIPKIEMPMKNFSMSGKFTLGGEVWGLHGKIGLSGFYSAQELLQTTRANPAYGYLYAENGQHNMDALLDFNREKDGSFTENTPSLPLTNFTFDTYGVSGQGISGSYRPFRGDIGCVFDAQSYTTNDNDALTVEVGVGGYAHVGANLTVIDVFGKSGKWKNDNEALYNLVHVGKGHGNDFENVYFKEANEKGVDSDPSFFASAGESKAVRFDVDLGKFDHKIKNAFDDGNNGTYPFSGPIKRKARDKKTQNISFLKKSEYSAFAVEEMPGISSSAQNHHIAEITTLGIDGSRYVYGIAAYNTSQKEITFSVGSNAISSHDNDGALLQTAVHGIVAYTGSDNSLNNSRGIDNYYSCTETPAYAHSYLLTSVLSGDYIDADSVRGPSDADYGTYTKFRYSKVAGYKWRTPVEANKATFAEGLKSDFQDDKGNIVYGEKDVWFMDSIITKNYVAIFHKSNRFDGQEVASVDGGAGSLQLKKLDSISLYSKRDPGNVIKRVHFEYSYALCPGTPNSIASGTKGKLTLKKIYFTYQGSYRGKLSPYVFDYHEGVSAENPAYNIKAYDRWGNYKPNAAVTLGVRDTVTRNASSFVSAVMPASDYPYTEQNPTLENVYASVWNLKEIDLPSGGTIKVTYESDDYAYVQNKQAGEMFKVINYNNASVANSLVNFGFSDTCRFYFQPHNGSTNIDEYVQNLKYVYFRFLVNIKTHVGKPHLEYVSGYGELDTYGFDTPSNLCWIKLKTVTLKDNGGTSVNPVVKASVNFGRIHLPKVVWDATAGNISGTLSGAIIQQLVNSSFIKNIRDAVQGPSEALFNSYNVGKEFVAGKSWFRLNNPDGHKLGGGHRVKKIEMVDNWSGMAGSGNGQTSNYGQEYVYNLDDGRSSGVAAYEPQLGGDENCFKQPVFSNTKKLMVPDDESYTEEPFGESFFPSPSVGYSQVTVRNLVRTGVSRHATGKKVNEFYTAKDFPTKTSRTAVKFKRGKDGPGSIRSLLKINVRDYFAATQGFAIELNDMHGKPKSEKVYQENQSVPITSIEYKYKSDPYLNGSFVLNNSCTVVEKNGTVSQKNIGMSFDMVGDLRESTNDTRTTAAEGNLDVIPILLAPAFIVTGWPTYAKDKTRFRSATLTKVIQRFGILEETIAKDLGSVVSTKNIAYDAETGGVLLTETKTDYNDYVYSMKYPAWWYYDDMGPAYRNLGFQMSVTSSGGNANVGSLSYMFKPGDELALNSGGSSMMAWVKDVTGNVVKIIDKAGAVVSGSYDLKIIRSGNRNNLTTDMATLLSLSNPLASLQSNAYQKVLQAGAIEFSNKRKTHCNCISQSGILPTSVNPYILGTLGTWRQIKAYTHLTSRSQSNVNKNSNIRQDGVFESYSPFYASYNGGWKMIPDDWTSASEVTEFNVYGHEVENKDALDRYSSATYGYNQAMPLSVAANSMYKEQGFDGFEDYRFNPCVDDHFKYLATDTTSSQAHTGRYSYKIVAGNPRTMTKQINLFCAPATECMIIGVSTLIRVGFPPVYQVSPSTGTAPYSYTWNVNYGNPTINFWGTNLEITGTNYSVEVTITDSKGCSKKNQISN